MPAVEYLVNPVPIGFNLALETVWEWAVPARPLLPKESLKFDRRRSTRIIEQLQASNPSVAVEDDELVLIRRDERKLIDLTAINDILCEVAHMLLALFEEPSDSGCIVF